MAKRKERGHRFDISVYLRGILGVSDSGEAERRRMQVQVEVELEEEGNYPARAKVPIPNLR
jgi:hypothetical protein